VSIGQLSAWCKPNNSPSSHGPRCVPKESCLQRGTRGARSSVATVIDLGTSSKLAECCTVCSGHIPAIVQPTSKKSAVMESEQVKSTTQVKSKRWTAAGCAKHCYTVHSTLSLAPCGQHLPPWHALRCCCLAAFTVRAWRLFARRPRRRSSLSSGTLTGSAGGTRRARATRQRHSRPCSPPSSWTLPT
jgi:hypothetical protein